VTELEFRILGPIEVVGDGEPIRLGGPRQRAVLAVLVLRANQVVPVERLAEEVYGGEAPATAVGQVRDHVSQLRKLLPVNGSDGSRLETRPPGYVLHTERVDAVRFERAVEAAGREVTADPATAAAMLREALALWRGPPLADFAYDRFAASEIERLDELRLIALGLRIDADLAVGRHAVLVGELEALVAAHPLRDQFLRQLMLALYRSGRQAEALDAYHTARKTLTDELGLEMAPELRELATRILQQDPSLQPAPVEGSRVSAAPQSANPYKGLRAFRESDAADFFGRETLTARLVQRIEASRFLAVIGPSGSGKSSVVRAGLVPALRPGLGEVIVMSPGAHPIEELEAALLRIAVNPPASLLPQLESGELGVLRAVKRALPDDTSELLLVIDQFEELFTLVDDDARRREFLAGIAHAIRDPLSRMRVVATLRADFYDRPLRDRVLAELLRDNVEIVPPLAPDEIERAITAPARRAGCRLEEGLLAEIVADVLEEPGALPLLQYALTELFERRDGDVLTRAAYTDLGGVSGALAHRAEAIYSGATDAGREAARQLFLRLVTFDGGSPARRRAGRGELQSLDVDQMELEHSLEAFGSSRLLSFDRDPRTGEPTVEVAHEALLENWSRLREWIDVVREDVTLRRRVASAAAEWAESEREPSFLLRGVQLARVEAAADRSTLAQTELEREYVGASLAQRDAERAAARRSLNRLRALVVALLVVSVVGVALALFAFDRNARSKHQTRIATARQLAAASLASLEVDPDRAILLAMRAVEMSPPSELPEATDALHRAIENSRLMLTIPHAGSAAVAFDPTGSRLATAGPGASVWDAATGRRLLTLRLAGDQVHDIAYDASGKRLATGGADKGAVVWNARTGARLATLKDVGGQVSVSFSPDGKSLATDDYAGVLRIWDLATSRVVRSFRSPHPLCGVAWSPDGSHVGAGDCGTNYATASGRIWDVRTGRLVPIAEPQYGAALTLAFSPDGHTVATPNLDGTAEVWDGRSGKLTATFRGHTGLVYSLAFGPDGRMIATGGTDGTVRLWDPKTGVQQLLLPGQRGIVNDVAFSHDGGRLATIGEDGTARIWNIGISGSRDWLTIRAHRGSIESIFYAPGGTKLVSAGDNDGKVKVWNPLTGKLVAAYENPADVAFRFTPFDRIYYPVEETSPDATVAASARSNGTIELRDPDGTVRHTLPSRRVTIHKLAFSSDGKRIASGYFDGKVIVWDVATGRRIRTLSAQNGVIEGLAFSPDGTTLATAGEDAVVTIWDLRTGRNVQTLGGSTSALADVAFSPDGTHLAAASADGTLRIYVLPKEQLLAIARRRLTRTWTADECVQFLHESRCPSQP
jgi:WD40 repeat protein/DNA-binding SARP family transcriptional activator